MALKIIGIEAPRMSLEASEGYIDSLCAGILEEHEHDMVVLPEKWVSEIISAREHEKLISRFAEISSSYGSTIIPGSFAVETSADSRQNIATVIQRGKILGHQAKISLFMKEAKELTPGKSVETFRDDGVTLAVAVCYDLDFPYFTKVAAERGASLIINPSLIPQQFHDMWHIYVTARALENRVAVLSLNSSSSEFSGNSIAAVPYMHEWGVRLSITRPENNIVSVSPDMEAISAMTERRIKEDPGRYSLGFKE